MIDNSNATWELMRIKAAENYVPFHGHFELTPRCNLNCKMCYIHLSNDQMKGTQEISLEKWMKIIDDAVENGMIFASLTGGECLTYPHFKEIFLHLQDKGVFVTVLTNGVLLDTMIDFFVAHPPRLIQVSVYGNDEDDYERVTGVRACERVKRAIDTALQANLPISIALTPNKYFTDILPLIEHYKSKGVPGGVAEFLMAPKPDTGRNIEDFSLSVEQSIRLSTVLYQANNEGFSRVDINTDEIAPDKPIVREKGLSCVAGRCDFTINWKGEMLLCSALDDIAGHPLTDGFLASWHRANELSRNYINPVECVTCEYYKYCTHCPANHLAGAKPGHCDTRICDITKELVKLGVKNWN